jgi:hypothetical protein
MKEPDKSPGKLNSAIWTRSFQLSNIFGQL